MTLISATYEAIDMIADYLEDQSGPLGLNYVGKYNEERIPRYPAVVIIPGSRKKELHATNTFQSLIIVDLYVYHAQLTLSKRERSKEDLKLVDRIEGALESDYTWKSDPNDPSTQRIIFGYVSEEEPGALQPRANKSTMIIATRLTWRGLTQRRFDA